MEHLLGPEQGYKTNILLAQAKSLEAKQGSKSAHQLLERQETLFLNYLPLKKIFIQVLVPEGDIFDLYIKKKSSNQITYLFHFLNFLGKIL